MTPRKLHIWIDGMPQSKGSGIPFRNRRTHKLGVRSTNKNVKCWEEMIRLKVLQEWRSGPLVGPIKAEMTFCMTRAWGAIGLELLITELDPSAGFYHMKRPDLDKLQRAVLDALTGVVYVDDSQVVMIEASK